MRPSRLPPPPPMRDCPGLGLRVGLLAWTRWAAKQRRKGDRLVIACQEQTYWLVNRPPVSPWGSFLHSRGVLPRVSVLPHVLAEQDLLSDPWEGHAFRGSVG